VEGNVMPSHPDRVRENYKCIFCKGTGWVVLINANDETDRQAFTCGSCKGVGTTIKIQRRVVMIRGIHEVSGY
jgi:DnaJ-class molecular chaperone